MKQIHTTHSEGSSWFGFYSVLTVKLGGDSSPHRRTCSEVHQTSASNTQRSKIMKHISSHFCSQIPQGEQTRAQQCRTRDEMLIITLKYGQGSTSCYDHNTTGYKNRDVPVKYDIIYQLQLKINQLKRTLKYFLIHLYPWLSRLMIKLNSKRLIVKL